MLLETVRHPKVRVRETEAAMQRQKSDESKFGLTYGEAMRQGMVVARKAARQHYRWVNTPADRDDLLAAAYEGLLLAWRAWKGPEVVAWTFAVKMYCETYARREANRRKSVVTTGAACYGQDGGRRALWDASLEVRVDGEWVPREIENGAATVQDRLEDAEALSAIGNALAAAIASHPHTTLARSVVCERILTDSPTSAALLAQRLGVTSASVYRAEREIREAAGI